MKQRVRRVLRGISRTFAHSSQTVEGEFIPTGHYESAVPAKTDIAGYGFSRLDDVNHIIHRILRRLRPGVFIHFHDGFYPFEYLRPWLLEGRAWTEGDLPPALLELNDSFEIVLLNTSLKTFFEARLRPRFPSPFKNPGGLIWARRRC